jgi:hypothetical protein
VLLPATMLARRGDWAVLIGGRWSSRPRGWGQRPIAAAVGVARSTVRGWLSRFAVVAEQVRAHLVRWALWLDAGLVRLEPSGSRSVTRSRRSSRPAARPPPGSGSAAAGRSRRRRPAGGCCATRARPSRDRGWAERSRLDIDQEHTMEDPRRRDIALFRYGLIREAADPELTPAERGRLVRDLAAEGAPRSGW